MRIDLNFASRDYVYAARLYAGLLLALLASGAVFAGLYVSHASDVKDVGRLERHIKERRSALAVSEQALMDYEKSIDGKLISSTYTEADFANEAIRRRVFSWTLFLNRIEKLVPSGVGITGIKPDYQTLDVDISGTAKSMDAVTGFIESLTRSEYFGDVPPTFGTSEEKVKGERGLTLQHFNIKIRYVPGGDAAPGGRGEGGVGR